MAQNANELTLGFNSFVAYLQYRMQRLKKHYYAYVSPLKLTSELYREKLGRVPDLHHPKTFNEKVLWLKHFSDTSRWTQLADKYRVREYVEQCGLGWMLNELYAVWERPEEIDLTLPQLQGREFVLKTNNGCGDVILVSDARTADLKSIRHKMKRALRYHYGFKSAEHHYMFIKPCIIAEKMLHENPALSCSLIDYKFFCLDGEPCYCMVCYDRQGHGGVQHLPLRRPHLGAAQPLHQPLALQAGAAADSPPGIARPDARRRPPSLPRLPRGARRPLRNRRTPRLRRTHLHLGGRHQPPLHRGVPADDGRPDYAARGGAAEPHAHGIRPLPPPRAVGLRGLTPGDGGRHA